MNISDKYDVQDIASCFKMWLRELPESVVPKAYFEDCLAAYENADSLKATIRKLPSINHSTLALICKFLVLVASRSEINLMSANNLAIVFGPCLIAIPADDKNPVQVLKETLEANKIVRAMIDNYKSIFEEPGPDQKGVKKEMGVPLESVGPPLPDEIISVTRQRQASTQSSSSLL